MTFQGGYIFPSFWGSISESEWSDWKWHFAHRITTAETFQKIVKGTHQDFLTWQKVSESYPINITPYYFSLVDFSDENDPLRKQCCPDIREIDHVSGDAEDPLREERDMPVPGLIHRYNDRCVVLITHLCAMYCRHCNRKRLWRKNREYTTRRDSLRMIIDYISEKHLLREVIISGGDPLILSDEELDWFLGEVRSISHVEVIRLGSRIPVVMPMRITDKLCTLLRKHRPLWFNTQFNHPREITKESARACEMILESGIPVSNQTVLLKGINDTFEIMRDLVYGLQRISVRPYYLFHCEPVKGVHHFRTDIQRGIHIMENLWSHVSGLCIPRYVYDLPGGKGKIPLFPQAFTSIQGKTEHLWEGSMLV